MRKLEINDIIEYCKSGNHYDVEHVLIVSFTKVFNNIDKFEYRGENSLNKWI